MTALTACCPHRRASALAPSADERRRRRHALGSLALMLCVVGQMILACQDRPAPASPVVGGVGGAQTVATLIAASLCRTSAAPATDDPGGGTTIAGCLHCTSGGCHGTARTTSAAAWPAFADLNLPARPRSEHGNDGAAPWQIGHPVRGPPSSGL